MRKISIKWIDIYFKNELKADEYINIFPYLKKLYDNESNFLKETIEISTILFDNMNSWGTKEHYRLFINQLKLDDLIKIWCFIMNILQADLKEMNNFLKLKRKNDK
jgi:hypothetical protein